MVGDGMGVVGSWYVSLPPPCPCEFANYFKRFSLIVLE